MTWTRRRWMSAFAATTVAAVLRTRRAAAATPPLTPRQKRPVSVERVPYKTRWIGHF